MARPSDGRRCCLHNNSWSSPKADWASHVESLLSLPSPRSTRRRRSRRYLADRSTLDQLAHQSHKKAPAPCPGPGREPVSGVVTRGEGRVVHRKGAWVGRFETCDLNPSPRSSIPRLLLPSTTVGNFRRLMAGPRILAIFRRPWRALPAPSAGNSPVEEAGSALKGAKAVMITGVKGDVCPWDDQSGWNWTRTNSSSLRCARSPSWPTSLLPVQ